MFSANKKLGLRDEEGGTVLGNGDPGLEKLWWRRIMKRNYFQNDYWMNIWINFFHFNDWPMQSAFPSALQILLQYFYINMSLFFSIVGAWIKWTISIFDWTWQSSRGTCLCVCFTWTRQIQTRPKTLMQAILSHNHNLKRQN